MSRSKSSQSPLPLLEPRNPKQGRYARLLEQHELVFAVGPAGTGKTYIAAHRAANVLADGGNLIIIRPTVTVEDEDMGFLPGDLQEKIDPYMKPVMQELTAIAGKDRTRLWAPQIECCPIAYIRGRTFHDAFVHVSEAQNLTLKQAEAIVTRMGENCQMVIEGDPDQSDLPCGGALQRLLNVAKMGAVPYGEVRFTADEVVRSAMVKRWVKAFAQERLGAA